MNRRYFMKLVGYGGPASVLLSKIAGPLQKLEPPAEKFLRFIVPTDQRFFFLQKVEGGSPSQITSILVKYSQGGQWSRLLANDYVVEGPENDLVLWINRNVADWIEEVKVFYR